MFRLQLNNPIMLKSIFVGITEVLDEIQITVDEEGLKIIELDRGHVLFINLNLKKDFFEGYSCEEEAKFNIDADDIKNALKYVKKDDRLILSEDDKNLLIIIESESRTTYKIEKLDIPLKVIDPIIINYSTEFDLDFKTFKGFIARINQFYKISKYSYHLTLEIDETYFKIRDKNNVSISYIHGEKIKKEACSSCDAKYLTQLLKTDKFTDIIEIKLGNDEPLTFTLKNLNETAVLSYMLAPRILED